MTRGVASLELVVDTLLPPEIIIAQEEAIVDTFDEKNAICHYIYQDFLELPQTMSVAAIAHELGIKEGQAYGWKSQNTAPPPVKAIGELKNASLCPLHPESEQFRIMNLVAAWNHYSGSITSSETMPGSRLNEYPSTLKVAQGFLKEIDLDIPIKPQGNGNGPTQRSYMLFSSTLTRLLIGLGSVRGNRNEEPEAIPRYIDHMIDSTTDPFLGNVSQEIREQTLIDFVVSQFFLKGYAKNDHEDSHSQLQVNGIGMHDLEDAKHQQERTLSLLDVLGYSEIYSRIDQRKNRTLFDIRYHIPFDIASALYQASSFRDVPLSFDMRPIRTELS